MKCTLPVLIVMFSSLLVLAGHPKAPVVGSERRQSSRRPAVMERQYQLNRFFFLSNLRRESGGTAEEAADVMLKRLFEKEKAEVAIVTLDVRAEQLTVRGSKEAMEVVWRLVRALNGAK